jgi:excisionase family DNA binding protein
MQKLLNAAEMAEILGVTKSCAYQIMGSGEIAVVRFGRSVRVTEEDLQAYIDRNRTQIETPWYERMKVAQ